MKSNDSNIKTLDELIEDLKEEVEGGMFDNEKRVFNMDPLISKFYAVLDRLGLDVILSMTLSNIKEHMLGFAYELIDKEAQKGNQEAKLLNAILQLYTNRSPKSDKQVLNIFQDLVNNGNARAIRYLGLCYYHRIGKRRSDHQAALECYEKASKAGDKVAKILLNNYNMRSPRGVIPDVLLPIDDETINKTCLIRENDTLKYEYEESAKYGDMYSLYQIARKNRVEGVVTIFEAYEELACKGDIDAINQLYSIIEKISSEGVIPGKMSLLDRTKLYLEKAAKFGDPKSRTNLAKLYSKFNKFDDQIDIKALELIVPIAFSTYYYSILNVILNNLLECKKIKPDHTELFIKSWLELHDKKDITYCNRRGIKNLRESLFTTFFSKHTCNYILGSLENYYYNINWKLLKSSADRFEELDKEFPLNENDLSKEKREFNQFKHLYEALPKDVKLLIIDYFMESLINNKSNKIEDFYDDLIRNGYNRKDFKEGVGSEENTKMMFTKALINSKAYNIENKISLSK